MPSFFVVLVYLAGYVFLVFAAVCLASGLYYLAELAEENTRLTKKVLQIACLVEIPLHVLLILLESVPALAVLSNIAAHLIYLSLLASFPFMEPKSVNFVASTAAFIASNVLWFRFFTNTHEFFYQYRLAPTPAVASFFFLTIWFVPIGLFVSLTINDSVLPGAGTDGLRTGGLDHAKKRSHLLSGVVQTLSFYGRKVVAAVTGQKDEYSASSSRRQGAIHNNHDW